MIFPNSSFDFANGFWQALFKSFCGSLIIKGAIFFNLGCKTIHSCCHCHNQLLAFSNSTPSCRHIYFRFLERLVYIVSSQSIVFPWSWWGLLPNYAKGYMLRLWDIISKLYLWRLPCPPLVFPIKGNYGWISIFPFLPQSLFVLSVR